MFYKILGDNPHKPKNKTVWTLKSIHNANDASIKRDDIYLKEGYIVITPMSINENNTKLLNSFQERMELIPEFSLK